MDKQIIANIIFTIACLGLALWLLYVAIFKQKAPAKPLNRRERRQLEFANKSHEEMRERRHNGQKEAFKLFKHTVEQFKFTADNEHHSVHKFTTSMLGLAEVQFQSYAAQCRKKNLLDLFPCPYNYMVMYVVCKEIIEYSKGLGYEHISFELSKFVEKHFQITALRSVIQRHKGRVHYDERCIAMARSILEFFTVDREFDEEVFTLPMDFYEPSILVTWEHTRKDFYHKAIDQSYNKMMRAADKINYDLKTKRENQVHADNQRQRAKRIAKRSRKRYA